MQWLRSSIQSLELYRRVILETRRASRVGTGSIGEPPRFDDSTNDGGGGRSAVDSMLLVSTTTTSGFNETENIRDLNDILGPLPDVPDSNVNWSRRVSGVSGIYEEIMDSSGGERGTPPTGRCVIDCNCDYVIEYFCFF